MLLRPWTLLEPLNLPSSSHCPMFLVPLAPPSSLLSLDFHTPQYLPFPDTPQALPLLLLKAQAPEVRVTFVAV